MSRMSVGFAHSQKTGAAVLMVMKPIGSGTLVVCRCLLTGMHRPPVRPLDADYRTSRHPGQIQTDSKACLTGPNLETPLHRPLAIAFRIRAYEGETVSPLCQTHSRWYRPVFGSSVPSRYTGRPQPRCVKISGPISTAMRWTRRAPNRAGTSPMIVATAKHPTPTGPAKRADNATNPTRTVADTTV